MILVDTSVWIEHLSRGDAALAAALDAGQVVMHPFVIGEIALGRIVRRAEVLDLMRDLPSAPVAEDEEILAFIELRGLAGQGVGYVDAHLLASASLIGGAGLWTYDRQLARAAKGLQLAHAASRA